MQGVFVLSSDHKPLDLCHPARARKLLKQGRAAIFRRQPFTIILKDRTAAESVTHPHRLKFDPGSKTTGIAIVQEQTGEVVWAAELQYKSNLVADRMEKRAGYRGRRRTANLRHRPPRFRNRRREKGWLTPCMRSRVGNIRTWTAGLMRVCPITAFSLELVKFDTQAMQNPEISGVEYQRGTLVGWEVREYLLEKWDRKCAYCGAKDVPFEVEHILPKSRGGTDRVSNLTLACHECNQAKGNQTAAEFGHPEVQAEAKQSLKDAAAVTTTRWAVYAVLRDTGLPVETGTGGRTKYNRTRLGLPKAHWIDAACVGASTPDALGVRRTSWQSRPLIIRAMGRGSRQMCRMDKHGFPRTAARSIKRVHGFQTGDLVRAIVPTGKHAGTHVGRVAVRASGSFRVGTVDGIGYRHCRLLQRTDGYEYVSHS
jgi:5-methylcytosine-specific restriction endonuclease McrA